jgi:hypothetical protein
LREVQFIACFAFCTRLASLAMTGLTVLFGAAVEPLIASLAQSLLRKRGPCAMWRKPLQARSVLFSYAQICDYRKGAVALSHRLFGFESGLHAPPNIGAQDALAHASPLLNDAYCLGGAACQG